MIRLETGFLNNPHIPSLISSLPWFTIFLIIIIIIALLLYYMKYYHQNYWKRHGITYVKPIPFLGNLKDIVINRKSVADVIYDAYFSKPMESILGFYFFHKPMLIIRHPELIKNILVKDFNYFSNRFTTCDQKSDLLSSSNLLLARNPFWKKMRLRLSPLFSSALRRKMFYLINDIGISLNKYLLDKTTNANNNPNNSNEIIIEFKDFTTRYTTDVIAACAFGVDSNSIENPNSEFRKGGKSIVEFNLLRGYEFMSFFFLPDIVPLLKLKPAIQKRLRQEIKEYLLKTNGNLTHDDIMKMEYLDMVVSETLRLYPPLPHLDRVCQLPNDNKKGYSLNPHYDYEIPDGMGVILPVFAIHRDPQYFPNPTKFDPERFSPSNKVNIKPYTYFPFGLGPRMCIASKFALMASKIGLIHVLQNHFVDVCEKTTPKEIQFKPTSILLQSIDGLFLKVIKDHN